MTENEERPVLSLLSARDMLLPGLYAICQRAGVEAGIIIRPSEGMIVLGKKDGYELGFVITAAEIADGVWKQEFEPRCRSLVMALNQAVGTGIHVNGTGAHKMA